MQSMISAIDVTAKTFFERFYFVLQCSTIVQNFALCHLSLRTHNSAHSLYNYFSISEQFFPLDCPLIFKVHDSPLNLAESRY